MYSPKEVLVTTTSNLEGWEIKQYIKPVSSHFVAGTDFFSDFFAAFSDVFGGRSNTYQRQISALYNDAIEQLKFKAFELGANCIVGLTVDMDEISGKGKSMFMITATGTAVKAEAIKQQYTAKQESKVENVSADDLLTLHKRKAIITKAAENKLDLNDETWSFISNNKVHEVFDYVLKKWKEVIENNPDSFNSLFAKTITYLESLDDSIRHELVYNALNEEKNDRMIASIGKLIRDLRLLNYDLVRDSLQSTDFTKQKRSLIALTFDKPFYNKEDITELQKFIDIIKDTFKERGTRSMKKQLLSSKEKEVWTCQCGKQNDIGSYCSGCHQDIYGFKSNEAKPQDVMERLEYRIELVKECLN